MDPDPAGLSGGFIGFAGQWVCYAGRPNHAGGNPGRLENGKHSHGEEAMFIIEGEGCTVIDGERFDWEKGSTLFIPFGAVHQHFNTGSETVRFVAANAIHLERFVGLAKLVQYEDAAEQRRENPPIPGRSPVSAQGSSADWYCTCRMLPSGWPPMKTARRITSMRAGSI